VFTALLTDSPIALLLVDSELPEIEAHGLPKLQISPCTFFRSLFITVNKQRKTHARPTCSGWAVIKF